MFQPWRLQLRQATMAFQEGLLDEAGRLLRHDRLQEYQPGRKLCAKVADGLAERGEQHARCGDTSAGWRDLETAAHLAGDTQSLIELRNHLVERALKEAEKHLEVGDVASAMARLEKIHRRGVDCESMRTLMKIAKRVDTAKRQCRRGGFESAELELAHAARLRPDLPGLADRHRACQAMLEKGRNLSTRMQTALEASRWQEALDAADAWLQLAPEYAPAREVRQRAWRAMQRNESPKRRVDEPQKGSVAKLGSALGRRRVNAVAKVKHVTTQQPSDRFLMWVDAVGGFLVCLDDEVVLGQPVPGGGADVPILGDLSRRQAVIRREGENYMIWPAQQVKVNGELIVSATLLTDGSTIELGEAVKLRFRKPHPLSATARLDFLSNHRTQPAADSVLLMASTCILGASPNCHVMCRDWTEEVVLYRGADQLHCRAAGTLQVDGAACEGRVLVTKDSHIAGEDFSMTLERV